jgi:hypothetical protein
MADIGDDLQYDVMVENALRGVVRQALAQVSEGGLPGEHHFYITFRSDHPDVVIPEHLRERYPREMTIVLQYQFWDLEVGSDGFAVTLSFNNRSERLNVPFEAVIAFADPSVRFGLQFDAGEEDAAGQSEADAPTQTAEQQNELAGKGDSAPKTRGEAEGEGDGNGNVVTLDQFRKKQ